MNNLFELDFSLPREQRLIIIRKHIEKRTTQGWFENE